MDENSKSPSAGQQMPMVNTFLLYSFISFVISDAPPLLPCTHPFPAPSPDLPCPPAHLFPVSTHQPCSINTGPFPLHLPFQLCVLPAWPPFRILLSVFWRVNVNFYLHPPCPRVGLLGSSLSFFWALPRHISQTGTSSINKSPDSKWSLRLAYITLWLSLWLMFWCINLCSTEHHSGPIYWILLSTWHLVQQSVNPKAWLSHYKLKWIVSLRELSKITEFWFLDPAHTTFVLSQNWSLHFYVLLGLRSVVHAGIFCQECRLVVFWCIQEKWITMCMQVETCEHNSRSITVHAGCKDVKSKRSSFTTAVGGTDCVASSQALMFCPVHTSVRQLISSVFFQTIQELWTQTVPPLKIKCSFLACWTLNFQSAFTWIIIPGMQMLNEFILVHDAKKALLNNSLGIMIQTRIRLKSGILVCMLTVWNLFDNEAVYLFYV